MIKELGKQAGRNLWEMPCLDSIGATANEYLATVYLKHRSLQSRKATYRGWHLPSAGKLKIVGDPRKGWASDLSSSERQQ